MKYEFHQIESKWQKKWIEDRSRLYWPPRVCGFTRGMKTTNEVLLVIEGAH